MYTERDNQRRMGEITFLLIKICSLVYNFLAKASTVYEQKEVGNSY